MDRYPIDVWVCLDHVKQKLSGSGPPKDPRKKDKAMNNKIALKPTNFFCSCPADEECRRLSCRLISSWMAGYNRKIPPPLKENLYQIIADIDDRPVIIKEVHVQKPPQIIEADVENEPQINEI